MHLQNNILFKNKKIKVKALFIYAIFYLSFISNISNPVLVPFSYLWREPGLKAINIYLLQDNDGDETADSQQELINSKQSRGKMWLGEELVNARP